MGAPLHVFQFPRISHGFDVKSFFPVLVEWWSTIVTSSTSWKRTVQIIWNLTKWMRATKLVNLFRKPAKSKHPINRQKKKTPKLFDRRWYFFPVNVDNVITLREYKIFELVTDSVLVFWKNDDYFHFLQLKIWELWPILKLIQVIWSRTKSPTFFDRIFFLHSYRRCS